MFMSPRRREAQVDDATTLMSDVWTFMAILGICLAVIFALIQSMPFTSDSRHQVQPLEKAQEQRDLQSVSPRELDKEIMKVTHETPEMQDEMGSLPGASETAAKNPENNDLQESDQSASATEGWLLSDVKSSWPESPKEKDENMEQDATREAELKERINKARESLAQARQDSVRSEQDEAKKDQDESQEKNEDQGFSLRFASEQSLQSLLADNRVDFYIIVGGRAWKLQDPYSPSYSPAQVDETLYQMLNHTVPEAYIEAARAVGEFGEEENKTYHVYLSSSIQEKLDTMTADASGGELIIHGDGRVSLE